MTRRAGALPMPGPDLMRRVAGSDDTAWFVESGRRSLADIRSVLALAGQDIENADRVLDFGCGCGRVLRHLEDAAERVEIHGVDIDREAIEWLRTSLPFVHATAIEPLPPLPFPDEHFDLVVNHSVLSHLPEDYQDAWLGELSRVTRPGALVELTVHGTHAFGLLDAILSASRPDMPAIREEFRERGFVYVSDEAWRSSFPDYYQNAYHAPGYVFRHWGRFFEVKALVTRGALDFQDIVLLRHA